MKMITILFFLVITIAITSCSYTHNYKKKTMPSCPSIDDNVTWQSYGAFKLMEAGQNHIARQIVLECGWHIFDGHDGKDGNTIQIASQDEEVILIWEYDTFYGFILNEGWMGATHKGAGMYEHNSNFYKLHSEFRGKNYSLSTYEYKNIFVSAYFSKRNFLEKIYVGHFFKN